MQQATVARAFLERLRPWVGKAIHTRWSRRRSFYQSELDGLLEALAGCRGRVPADSRLRLEGFLGGLHREWFPSTWRANPTYAETLADLEWWLDVAERWHAPPPKRRPRRRREPLAEQPEELCRILGLRADCTVAEFAASWRVFLKRHHPDLNPDQTAEERRHFASVMAMRRR
jgi:hypothetical protein